ncbi:MAG TPA: DUF3040 domain-containing protein [Marmoricola sp.]
MPLSEEELRLLEQMERALAEEDPKFVSALQGRTLERSAQVRAILAGVVFLVGLGLLVGGAFAQLPAMSIAGFVVMVASATFGLSAWRGRHAFTAPGTGHVLAPDSDAADMHPSRGGTTRRFTVVDGGRRGRRGGRPGPRRQARSHGSFMQRMEQRWERRRHEGP